MISTMQVKQGLVLLMVLLISSCTSTGVAPVSSRTDSQQKSTAQTPVTSKAKAAKAATKKRSHHRVVSGDTLYSISWNYQLDYKQIALWNNIKKPFVIYPGQLLRLTPPPVKAAKKATAPKTAPKIQGKPKPVKTTPKKTVTQKQVTKSKEPATYAKNVKWQWPTSGNLVKSNSPISKKGIDIAGKEGQIIKASAAGHVVYSGSGLLGYGKLIIIKHNATYLSAYAHNSQLIVKEGENVSSGQQIAKMGQDSNGKTLLHFEIRKNGKTVNPIAYLPKK